MSGKTLYIDCFSGVAGDMFVGALLDLGVGSIDLLQEELAKIDLKGWNVALETVRESGTAASRFVVNVSGKEQKPLSFSQIQDLVAGSGLSEKVRSNCLAIFSRVARAEAEAHGESLQTVHFHEVGMVDSIIDIVGSCILMEQLAPAEVMASPVALGSGKVETQHGIMRVPVPAATILLKGVPVYESAEKCELATPTGAALLTYFCDSYGPLPMITLERAGYGAGTRKTKGPNLLRMLLGERVSETGAPGPGAGAGNIERQIVVETNIDDSPAEQLAWLTERLLEAGAADAWLTPVVMKKGRPGTMLNVICAPEDLDLILDLIFINSSTFGVRVIGAERYCLDRRVETVVTRYGEIRVKIGKWRGRQVTASPEYEDCRRAAEDHDVPLDAVYEAARAAAG